jgi:hypothetical protein
MARKIDLDNNERAFLRAYAASDPDSTNWTCPWVSEITERATAHGADGIATTATGAMSVARRLTQRKLLEGDSDRGIHRGYSLTDKGRAALGQEA